MPLNRVTATTARPHKRTRSTFVRSARVVGFPPSLNGAGFHQRLTSSAYLLAQPSPWKAVAVADVNGDGVPDLIWQNLSTNQVTVNYYGGANGSVYQGFNWMNSAGEPSGRNVVGAADFDGNGTPDLVWQYAPTAQVTVNYYSYSQAGGPTNTGWAWLNNAGNPGWTVVGAADMNQDGVPDLIWIDQSDSQHAIGAVTVNYYGGSGGATYEGWAWLNQAGISGWSVGAVADMNSNGEPDLIWQDASPPNTVTAYYYSLAGVCDYTYDDLARLSAASCGSVWAQTFSYDAFGNIGKSGSQSFMPTYSAATNQMTSIGSFTPSYDSNGNLRGDGPYNTYSWDGEGNLAALNGNAETYDALNRRVEQYNGTAYTEIVYGPAGNKLALMNGQTATKVFAPLSGGATAVYNSSGLQYYRHPDWLGSSRVASTPGRTVYYNGAYAPYGENYAETGTTDRNFTGQNQDLTPGSSGILYDFLYREQHSTEGRWISPDRAALAAVDRTNPQTWNRYAYVTGNPLKYVDPRGLSAASSDCVWNGRCGCILDGVAVSCGSVSGLGSNGIAACPNNFCAGMANGVYMQYTADPNAAGFYSCLTTGSFSTQQQAGIAAVTCSNGLSIYYNREYVGNIYQETNGEYSFTPGIQQGPDSGHVDFNGIPDDTDFSGFYHTHGAFDINYNNEQFSGVPGDINTANSVRNQGFPTYLGTPLGRIEMYVPAQAGQYPNGCVLVGPAVSPGLGISEVPVPGCP
jgi:RHS repeat-associated protein